MATRSLPGFRAALRAHVDDALDEFGKRFDRLYVDAAQRIVRRTPRESGDTARKWQATLAGPPSSDTAPHDPLGQARSIAARADPFRDERWFSHRAPWIEGIERGSSDKQPRGMVRPTVRELRAENR